jgi:hypothetical protein
VILFLHYLRQKTSPNHYKLVTMHTNQESVQLETAIQRTHRRYLLAESLRNNPSWKVAVQTAKSQDKTSEVHDLVSSLSKKEFTTQPEVLALVEGLTNFLLERIQPPIPGMTIVLLGSAVHGGAALRSVMLGESKKKHDLDLALMHDANFTLSKAQKQQLNDLTDQFLSKDGRFTMCGLLNPSKNYTQHLTSAEEAAEMFIEFTPDLNTLTGLWDIPLNMYLNPGFPAKNIARNRELFAQGLRILQEYDNKQFIMFCEAFLKSWQEMHKISPKHLLPKDHLDAASEKDKARLASIEQISGQVMSNPIVDWINKQVR